MEAVAESAIGALDEIRRLGALREEHRDLLAGALGHAVGKGLKVHDRLFPRPRMTVSQVQAITGTSYVAANLLVSRFVDLGILEEVTGFRRNRVFHYGAFLRIFEADPRIAELEPEPAPSQSSVTEKAATRPRRHEVPAAKPESPPAAQAALALRKARKVRTPQLSDHLL